MLIYRIFYEWDWVKVGWVVHLTCPVLASLVVRLEESFSYTTRAAVCLVVRRVGSFSYTPLVGICLDVRRERGIFYTPRVSSMWLV